METENDESDGNEGGGLSTGGTLAIVLFVNLAAIGAIAYFSYRRSKASASSFEPPQTNLMARDAPQPPTLEEVLSKGSFHDYSERSNSHCSRVHDEDDDGGDGVFNVDEKANMVNVAII